MKHTLILLLSVMALVACKKTPDDTPKEDIQKAIERYSQEYPDGFTINIESQDLIFSGYAIAVQPAEGVSLSSILEEAKNGSKTISVWEEGDKITYCSPTVIENRDEAIAYAKSRGIKVICDLATKAPVYTYPENFMSGKKVVYSAVSMEAAGSGKMQYYNVSIDFPMEKDMFIIGKDLAHCVNDHNIWYNLRVWKYITESIKLEKIPNAKERVNAIKATLSDEYKKLIEGFAVGLPWSLYADREYMMYAANLLPDALRPTSCSAYGVMPEMSESGNVMVHRTLDWPDVDEFFISPGNEGMVAPLQSVTRMKYTDKTLYSVGLLGLFNAVTVIDATNQMMVGVLDSGVEGKYDHKGKRSYVFDLMSAIRSCSNIEDIASQMSAKDRNYAFNHLILLADVNEVSVLENNMTSGTGQRRAVRYSNSKLSDKIVPKWETEKTIGVVNSFMLDGQINNYDEKPGYPDLNKNRWTQQIDRTKEILDQKGDGSKLSMANVRDIQCQWNGSTDMNTWYKNLYNAYTFQMVEYVPQTNELEIFFKPFNASVNKSPANSFVKINIVR